MREFNVPWGSPTPIAAGNRAAKVTLTGLMTKAYKDFRDVRGTVGIMFVHCK